MMIVFNFSCHSRGETIDHVSISDDYKIQPATTPLPSCGYAHLMTPRLEQLSNCLQKTGKNNLSCYLPDWDKVQK